MRQGDLQKADEYFQRALAIRQKLAPGSTSHAESLASIAETARKRGQLEFAAKSYTEALHALESQIANMGGTEEARSGFRAEHSDYYKRFIDVLISIDQPGQAFAVLERSRARTLLEMMAAAHIDVHKGTDPSLLERENSLRAAMNAKSERRFRLVGEKQSEQTVKSVEKEIADLLVNIKKSKGKSALQALLMLP